MGELAKHLAKKDQRVKRLLAILGDMRELGEETALHHQLLAQEIADDFSEIYLVGQLMEQHVRPILQEKIKRTRRHTSST
jgi:UDP-N-acetylmuramyl pentapeptide synthase